jgi:hypothetical protein
MGQYMIMNTIGLKYTPKNWMLWKISWKNSDPLRYFCCMNSNTTETESLADSLNFKYWGLGLVWRKPKKWCGGLILESLPDLPVIQHLWATDLTYRERAIMLYGSEFPGILSTTIRLFAEFTVRGKRIRMYSFTTS